MYNLAQAQTGKPVWTKSSEVFYMQEFLSPRMRAPEVCALLCCSRSFLYSLHKRGLLRKYNDGRRFVYWLRSEVMAFAVGAGRKEEEGNA